MFVNQHEIRMVGTEKRRASNKQTPAARLHTGVWISINYPLIGSNYSISKVAVLLSQL